MKLSEILEDTARIAFEEWMSYGDHKYWWGLYKHPQEKLGEKAKATTQGSDDDAYSKPVSNS